MSGIKEGYGYIDAGWAAHKASSPFDIWTYNGGQTEAIEKQVQISKLGGLVIQLGSTVYSPSEIAHIAKLGPLVNLAFGEEARLTQSFSLKAAAVNRGSSADPIAQELTKIDRTLGFDLRWAIPLSAINPVIELDDIDQADLFEVASYNELVARRHNT